MEAFIVIMDDEGSGSALVTHKMMKGFNNEKRIIWARSTGCGHLYNFGRLRVWSEGRRAATSTSTTGLQACTSAAAAPATSA